MQKLHCWICDECRVIIDYGIASNPEPPHHCEKCSKKLKLDTVNLIPKKKSKKSEGSPVAFLDLVKAFRK